MRGFPLPDNWQKWLDDPMILCTAGRKEVEITNSVPANKRQTVTVQSR